MRKMLFLMLLCLPFVAMAQTDSKYLAGAIALSEGKVTFRTEIQAPSLSKQELYENMLKWAEGRFKPDGKCNARVLYADEISGNIAAGGEEYIVFSSSALSLDRTRIYYQLFVTCGAGTCNLEMTRIRYWYDEGRNGGEKYAAEEWITDDMALNKSKTKLAPICGKFRRGTINLKDALFKEVQDLLGSLVLGNTQQVAATPAEVAAPVAAASTVVTVGVPATPAPAPAVSVSAPASQDEQIKVATRITITAGNDEEFELGKECWGGFGQLFGKDVAFCLIDTQKTMGNMLLSQSETYRISFYLPGSNEPCAVVSCKKLMQQTITGEEAQKMNPSSDAEKSYNMYVGEVVK